MNASRRPARPVSPLTLPLLSTTTTTTAAMADPSFVPVLLALPSLTPSLALEILPHGLTFNRLYVQADGRTHDLLVGPENPTDHLRQKYTNTVVGRYANRLPVSSHTLAKAGVEATFAPRPNEAPTVSLHGGVQGWDSHFWEPVLSPYDAKLFTPAEVATIESELAGQTSVIFRRYSEDGEEGFPGRLLCEVFVALVPPKGVAQEEEHCLGSVVVIYRAQLEEANKVTPINLTQVCDPRFWRLGGVLRRFRSTGDSTWMRRSRRASRPSRTIALTSRCVMSFRL